MTVNHNLLHLLEKMGIDLDDLYDDELCIMHEHGHDQNKLNELVLRVRNDVDGTSKDLEMDG